MNHVFRKLQVCVGQGVLTSHQSLALCRAAPSSQSLPLWYTHEQVRSYWNMPTHEIGRWKHLLKKSKATGWRVRPQYAGGTYYKLLNLSVSGYDMTLVEKYAQHIHNLCLRLNIDVAKCYALPTNTSELLLLQEQGTKMIVDSLLKTHQRVVQVRRIRTTVFPILLDVVLSHQPEGVELSVKQNTEDDHRARYKARPELEALLAQIRN